MTEQVANVLDIVVDHGRAFKTQTPSDDGDILGQPHGFKHLGPENTRIADFNPLFQLRMEAKDLQAGFRVGVVRRLILQIFYANLCEESLHNS